MMVRCPPGRVPPAAGASRASANVRTPDEVDDGLVDLLAEAYHRTPA
jgi:hypothetical protein